MNYHTLNLPNNDVELTDEEYVDLIYEIKAKFLGWAAYLDTQLSEFITEIFLLNKSNDKSLWYDTVFDEDRQVTFGAKIVWLGKILKNHNEIKENFDAERRKNLINLINDIRDLRNDFAHTTSLREVSNEDKSQRRMWLIDHTGGYMQPKIISMNHVVKIVNNSDVLNDLLELTRLAISIRTKTEPVIKKITPQKHGA